MHKLITLTALTLVLVALWVGASIASAAPGHPGAEKIRAWRQGAVITEDDPRWDCRTMGNLTCGPTEVSFRLIEARKS